MVNNSGLMVATGLVNKNGSFELTTNRLFTEIELETIEEEVVNDNGTPDDLDDDFSELVEKEIEVITQTKRVSGHNSNSGQILTDRLQANTGSLRSTDNGSIEVTENFDFYGNLHNEGSILAGDFQVSGSWFWNSGLIHSENDILIQTNGVRSAWLAPADGRHLYSGPNGFIYVYSAPSHDWYGNHGYLQIIQSVNNPSSALTEFSILNSGDLIGTNNIDLTGQVVRNQGLIEAGHDLNLHAEQAFINESQVAAVFSTLAHSGLGAPAQGNNPIYRLFHSAGTWTAPGNSERWDNAGIVYQHGFWENTWTDWPKLNAQLKLVHGQEVWQDAIQKTALLSAGNHLNLQAPNIQNHAGLLEAGNDLNIGGDFLMNEQAILRQTRHQAQHYSTHFATATNTYGDAPYNFLDAWSSSSSNCVRSSASSCLVSVSSSFTLSCVASSFFISSSCCFNWNSCAASNESSSSSALTFSYCAAFPFHCCISFCASWRRASSDEICSLSITLCPLNMSASP